MNGQNVLTMAHRTNLSTFPGVTFCCWRSRVFGGPSTEFQRLLSALWPPIPFPTLTANFHGILGVSQTRTIRRPAGVWSQSRK